MASQRKTGGRAHARRHPDRPRHRGDNGRSSAASSRTARWRSTAGTSSRSEPSAEIKRRYRGRKVINARRKAVMPGLHDLHSHAGVELVKGAAERFPGKAWRNIMDFVAYHTSAEWWYVEAMLTALQRLKCGTTQALYMLGNAPRGDAPDIPEAHARGVEKIGLRSIAAFGPSRPPWPREYTYWRNGRRIERLVTLEETFEVTDDTIGRWNDAHKDGRVKMWVAVSRILNENFADQVYDPQNESLIRPQAEGIRRIMDKHNVGFHAHGMGTTAEYCYDADLGLLGPEDRVRARLAVQHALGGDPGGDRYPCRPLPARAARLLLQGALADSRIDRGGRSGRARLGCLRHGPAVRFHLGGHVHGAALAAPGAQ